MHFALCNTKYRKIIFIYLISSHQKWKHNRFIKKTMTHLPDAILLYSGIKMIFYVVFVDKKAEYGVQRCSKLLIFIMK
ncbi:hypothetical protein AD948_17250 [Acetobacter senegalensis]|uniref:Uncharacterized protein n=1 Tax=Acetobacter senegalensis TaxID=446692 RepID=A0A149TU03_9PROT|nr:hypothetical protein AD948_17250 [Acetobacter senegalensis]